MVDAKKSYGTAETWFYMPVPPAALKLLVLGDGR